MKKTKKKDLQDSLFMSFKSLHWWEEEVKNYLYFFDNATKTKYNKRILKRNQQAYESLVNRGNVELNIIENIEKEIHKYNAQKKKKIKCI